MAHVLLLVDVHRMFVRVFRIRVVFFRFLFLPVVIGQTGSEPSKFIPLGFQVHRDPFIMILVFGLVPARRRYR